MTPLSTFNDLVTSAYVDDGDEESPESWETPGHDQQSLDQLGIEKNSQVIGDTDFCGATQKEESGNVN